MSVDITYFVHGTTTDNEKNISSGWKDVELSELGVKQAKELREQTKNMDFDVVFCSDLKRAVDSAKYAFSGRAKIIEDSRIRECNYGIYNGKSSEVVEPLQEKNIEERFPKGESYLDVKGRIADFLKFLKENYEGNKIGIVAHKAPQLALDVLIKNMSWEEAFKNDWRKKKAWQPGWKYVLD